MDRERRLRDVRCDVYSAALRPKTEEASLPEPGDNLTGLRFTNVDF